MAALLARSHFIVYPATAAAAAAKSGVKSGLPSKPASLAGDKSDPWLAFRKYQPKLVAIQPRLADAGGSQASQPDSLPARLSDGPRPPAGPIHS